MNSRSRKLLILLVLFLGGCFHKYKGPDSEVLSFFEFSENDVLLVVKVTDTNSTDYYPPDVTKICFEDKNCFPWAYYYVHRAKVLDVLNGQFANETISFALLSHADYIDEVKREWYIKLKRFENEAIIEKLGTEFYVEEHHSKALID